MFSDYVRFVKLTSSPANVSLSANRTFTSISDKGLDSFACSAGYSKSMAIDEECYDASVVDGSSARKVV